MATDYNTIATDYQKTKVNPIKKYSEEYTFFQVLGDVRGKAVLDLACGDGYYTRLLRQAGADPVMGIDISSGMIQLAQEMEAREPLGIEYRVGNVATLGVVGAFEVVTAVFLLQYAPDETTLQSMVTVVSQNLKENGRFLTITGYPDITQAHLDAQAVYGVTVQPQGPLADGTPMHNTFMTPGGIVRFNNYHWTRPAYERVLQQAGFRSIIWHPMEISAEGRNLFPSDYWQSFTTYPGIILLECGKS